MNLLLLTTVGICNWLWWCGFDDFQSFICCARSLFIDYWWFV